VVITSSITISPCLQKSILMKLTNNQCVKDILHLVRIPEVLSRVHKNSLLADTPNYMDPVTFPWYIYLKLTLNFSSILVTLYTNRFNIQQLYAMSTFYLCVLYLSQNKQRLVPHKYKLIGFYNWDEKCLQRGTNWIFK